jgi:hypothetical protein
MTKAEIEQIKSALPKGWLDECWKQYVRSTGDRIAPSSMKYAIDHIIQSKRSYLFWLEWATNYLKELQEKEENLLNLSKICQKPQ